MRYLKKNGRLPCISSKLHEQVIDIIRIEVASLDAFNDLVQLGEVFELQRHVVFPLVMQKSLRLDVRFVAPNSVAATSASGRFFAVNGR